ncbi:MAG: DUF4296 domain-containing protein [Bacteroidota bacterium]|nr:DUF4296 domain-containing protein [Bacteroidota bacterium]
MKSILWDIMSAQNLASLIKRNDSSINSVVQTNKLTQKAFEIHKITAGDFDKSYNWYVAHPESMKLIFDSLYTQKQRENILQSKERIHQDSIQKKIVVNEQGL